MDPTRAEASTPTDRHRRYRWLIVGVPVVVVAILVAIVVSPTSDRDSDVVAVTSNDTATTAPDTAATVTGSTVESGAWVDVMTWVFLSCMDEQGYVIQIDFDATTELAYRACQDFMRPARLTPTDATYYACLRENGLELDPRRPTQPTVEAVKRAAVACMSLMPIIPEASHAGDNAYKKCMAEHGILYELPSLRMEQGAVFGPNEQCVALRSPPNWPPDWQRYIECFGDNGVAINLNSVVPAAVTDRDTVRRVARACRSLRPPNSTPAEYLNCLEDNGFAAYAPSANTLEVGHVARATCVSLQPEPTLDPARAAYRSCLSGHGVEIDLRQQPTAPRYDAATIIAAAHACRAVRPAVDARSVEHVDCLEDNATLSAFLTPTSAEILRTAASRCSLLRPVPLVSLEVVPPEPRDWHDCLAEHRLVYRPKAKPDYDLARAAAKACAALAPENSPYRWGPS
jgi:hypothetical protein